MLLANQGEDTAWRANHDVWRREALEELDVLLHRLSTVDDFGAHLLHELGKAVELVLDLVRQLAGVAEDQRAICLGVLGQILENGEHKDCSLAHARDCLAQNVNAKNSFGDTLLLHIRRVFEAAIGDGLLQFWLQQHVLEGRGMHAHVLSRFGGRSSSSVRSICSLVGFRLEDIFVVVGKVVAASVRFVFYHGLPQILVKLGKDESGAEGTISDSTLRTFLHCALLRDNSSSS